MEHAHICGGIHVPLPPGVAAYTAYPLGLQTRLAYPWEPIFDQGQLRLRAHGCRQLLPASESDQPCAPCRALEINPKYVGLKDRLTNGVNENSPYVYHGIDGLIEIARRKDEKLEVARLARWNAGRTIERRDRALADYKKLVIAIGHHDVPRIRQLVETARKQGASAQAICALIERAADGLYHAKSFDEKDNLVAYLMSVLGGPRAVRLAQRVFGGPSATTIRQQNMIKSLKISPSAPTTDEVLHNIDVCFADGGPLEYDAAAAASQGYVLLVDEIKVESRLRYDKAHNVILGCCREHSDASALEYNTIDDARMLEMQIEKGRVHRAVEVRGIRLIA